MTTQTLTLNSGTNTTAAFRAWGSAISSALAAMGLVQTTDTGQINWSTITVPSTATTVAGYEIWRFNDSLQSTKPIFIKLEYGTGATTTSPGMWITVGTATDGAGTITSMPNTGISTTARTAILPTANGSGGLTAACYFSAPDTSCVGAMLWAATFYSGWGGGFFMVERTRDSDGTPTGDGFHMIVSKSEGTNVGTAVTETRVFGTGVQPGSKSYVLTPGFPDPALQTVSDGTTLYPYPVFTAALYKLFGLSKLVVAIGKGDVPAGAQFTLTHYGAPHTFISAGQGTPASIGWGAWTAFGSTGTGLASFAMRFD